MMMTVAEIDCAVWAAHLDPRLQLAEVADDDLEAWAATLRADARGYWHGMSGRLAARLGITRAVWVAMVRIHRPEPAASIGDSSADLVPEILRRAAAQR